LSIIHEALKRAQSSGGTGAGAGEGTGGGPGLSGPSSPPPRPPLTRVLVAVALAVGAVALVRMGFLFLNGWEGRVRMPEPARLSIPSTGPGPGPSAVSPAPTAAAPAFAKASAGKEEAGAEELFYLGDLDGAERLLRQALAGPGAPDPVAANNLGLILKRKGASREALGFFELALRERPAFPEALNNRAVLLRKMGRAAEAEADLRTAIALDPSLAEAQLDYGVLLDSLGRKGEALRVYRGYLANPARIPGVEEALVRQRAAALEAEMSVTQWTGAADGSWSPGAPTGGSAVEKGR
jgi:Flp pilus assembly protein TadD